MLQSFEEEARTVLSRLKMTWVIIPVCWQKSPKRWPKAMSHNNTRLSHPPDAKNLEKEGLQSCSQCCLVYPSQVRKVKKSSHKKCPSTCDFEPKMRMSNLPSCEKAHVETVFLWPVISLTQLPVLKKKISMYTYYINLPNKIEMARQLTHSPKDEYFDHLNLKTNRLINASKKFLCD